MDWQNVGLKWENPECRADANSTHCSAHEEQYFFFSFFLGGWALGLELRAYTLSHSTSPFL
jgi:hypothetical protein